MWPVNVEAYEVFLDCAGQWRYMTPFGSKPIPTGIERSAISSTMQMLGTADTRDTLRRVQHIEVGALEVLRQ